MTKELTWAERNWTPKERKKLSTQLDQFDAQQLREIIKTVLEYSEDPDVAALYLRGSITGMAGRIEDQRKKQKQ